MCRWRDARAEREAKVLAAAREVFEDQGYRDTSIREIAERADVPESAVLETGNKSELFDQMFGPPETAALLGRFASWATHPGADFAEELDRVFFPWLEIADEHPEYCRDFLATTIERGGDPGARAREGIMVAQAVANRAQRWYPCLGPQDAADLAYGICAAEFTAMVAVLSGTLPVEQARSQVRATIALMLRGLD